MRTLRIRTFTMLCFFFLLLVPWIGYIAAHYMQTGTIRFTEIGPKDELLQERLTGIVRLIETNADKWSDPNWQNELQQALREAKLEAAIVSASDEDIFRSNPEPRSALSSTERFTIMEDGRLLGKIVIYLPKSKTVLAVSMIAGLLLAFFIVGVQMRRFLLKPLEKMSLAARQIAAGDWDAELPRSRISEISQVRDGFETMVTGLRQSFRKQARLEEERRFVIAAVAHDLRTPLFALRGYLDGLEQGIAQSPEKISKYVAVCKEKSAQLDRLVEDLFTFTKMEYVETRLNYGTADLKLILEKSIDSIRPLARQKRISISNRTADHCIVRGDTHLLERALNNLLDNAVRHTPSCGEIVVQCDKAGDRVTFAIRDTGPGFSAEELERVFEPLYRGEASRNRSTGGSGLGLTISQTIIRRHGGELAAGNHAEGGALLSGSIPADRPGPSRSLVD
ncbi:sensor histidine kinase [Paenibacillus ginsengihumi]|uniref:sensor histidine kinase n=1 Tax=Paenibacillus ginsengihumi TaxID=431596 RepID=UPI00036BD20C|nr:HAMP domain-containing sensor histidine kinase [Paenibacillus ginsengihumi]